METSEILRRTWADISLDAIDYNFRQVKSKLRSGTKVLAVVKADAYGHGDRMTAPFLEECGADWFGVSNLGEAMGIRESGVSRPILIFGNTPAELAGTLDRFKVTQAVYSLEYARKLSSAAVEAGVTLDIHLKFDTGMGRIGFVCDEERFDKALSDAEEAAGLPGLRVTGAFTHFASADELNEDGEGYTRLQFERFRKITDALAADGVDIGIRHCCNSAAAVLYPEMQLDMVRPGVILYGLYPDQGMKDRIKLKPAMELRTVVTLVKDYPKGGKISYGRRYTAQSDMKVASTAIGYADGYPRSLTNCGRMLVNGRFADVTGTVCMDQTMLDVSGIENTAEGDRVTVFGSDGDGTIPVEEVAEKAGTINYEIVCSVARRVPRCYYLHGENIHNMDYARWKER